MCFTKAPAGFTERPLRLIEFQWKLERISFLRNCGCKIRQLSIIASQQSKKMNQLFFKAKVYQTKIKKVKEIKTITAAAFVLSIVWDF